ncbi:hypothetical protein ACFYXH_04095 [Streptomyces sp. NPDC002730]|uniref:hypothetical protein n=1 Tax=Streptomyces sp. NPDC002730 TaxID=3364662 RepID=UPI0036890AE6
MAANRKFLVSAMVCATAIAGLAGCSKDTKAKGDSEEKAKEPAAATTSKAPVDPFAGLTADQIGDKALTATKAAQSIRMAGQIKSDGEQLTVDFAVDTKGACTGKMNVEAGKAELLQANKVLYMKGDEKFWRASMSEDGSSGKEADSVVELMKGRWMKMPAGSSGDMDGVCDLKAMIADMDKDKSERKGMTKGPDAEVDGQATATVVKKAANGETTTMYVAKEGEPYLLKVVKVGGDEPGTMVFSDYNKPVNAVAPPADQVVDLEKLGAGSGNGA